MTEKIFECRKCGSCCEGLGGIVLGMHDLDRIARFLKIGIPELEELYLYRSSNGKLAVRTGADGFCIFFRKNSGCSIHESKPDVCRAWPFFRGNLEDPISLELAKGFCPGINARIGHQKFRAAGLLWLEKEKLLDHEKTHEANALAIGNL